MASEIEDLTDKEKEALRLLLEGHDTKSSASLLGLSVHTINDRLRNARRKLGVSSSREAARILRDAEGLAPQNPAHRSFGVAGDSSSADNAILTQTKRAGPIRFTWLAGGMLIMSIVIAAAVIAVVSSPASDSASSAAGPSVDASSTASTPSTNPDDAVSMDQAEIFLASIDAGDFAQSWEDGGEFFQNETTLEEWTGVIEPVRSPLGAVEDRRLAAVQQLSTLPGAPEGDYEVLQFQTKFAGVDAISVETVIMVRNGSRFDVAGYFIR
ncbi:DUF4019 domain-containing protein [uncultured Erythrobacter sp.]|uniref:helix-turn-helix domain-containing protein n=1 Tax=uncultured Erythrobacter sp. TaxID=263913 RepID=UPI0026187BA1|nr:DUF4019 domain-containing protein [uncultured Erythrobacter sp.]